MVTQRKKERKKPLMLIQMEWIEKILARDYAFIFHGDKHAV